MLLTLQHTIPIKENPSGDSGWTDKISEWIILKASYTKENLICIEKAQIL